MPRPHAAAANMAVLALALLLAGCGGSGSSKTMMIKKTIERTAPAPITTTQGANRPSPVENPTMFQTPSHNVGCSITAAAVTCGIARYSYTPPATPTSCHLPGWGHIVGVARKGAGHFVCGDSVLAEADAPVLAYGKRVLIASFACGSREDGLTCTDRNTHHGFFVSRQQVRTW